MSTNWAYSLPTLRRTCKPCFTKIAIPPRRPDRLCSYQLKYFRGNWASDYLNQVSCSKIMSASTYSKIRNILKTLIPAQFTLTTRSPCSCQVCRSLVRLFLNLPAPLARPVILMHVWGGLQKRKPTMAGLIAHVGGCLQGKVATPTVPGGWEACGGQWGGGWGA